MGPLFFWNSQTQSGKTTALQRLLLAGLRLEGWQQVLICDGKGHLAVWRDVPGIKYLGPDEIEAWAGELELLAEAVPDRWFPGPDWWIILAAWLSHLIIDMIVGERGVPLLWPGEWHFYLITVRPGSAGELLVAACCALAVLYPLYAPQQATVAARTFANATPTPTATVTPTATPEPLIIRIPHVYDLETEILVQPGDRIEAGHLLADLGTWRGYNPLPPPPSPAETDPYPTATTTPTLTPTETVTPSPTPTWQPNPLVLAEAEARLTEARLRATLAAAPVPVETVTACHDAVERLRSNL